MSKGLSIAALSPIYRVAEKNLGKWQAEGLDVYDAREVVRKIWKGRTKPPEWDRTFGELTAGAGEDTKEYWQKEKLKEDAEWGRIRNAKARGECFDRADGEAAQLALSSAFKLALAEMEATLPPILAGMDEAGISEKLSEKYRELLEHLADDSSALWEEIYSKYATGDESESAQPAGAVGAKAKAEGKRQRGVRAQRAIGSGAGA